MPKDSTAAPAQSPVLVHGSVQFDLPSKISGRTYRIFVFQPASPPPPSGYPVVVVTDANMMFPFAATLDAAFALQGGKAALIVGIGYATENYLEPFFLRTRDLTPETPLSAIQPIPGLPPPALENYGGAEAFYRFLVEELRPTIADAYAVNLDDQTLYGHSLGGLFTLEVLFKHPESFRNFVASSPSIWWNKRAVLKGEKRFVAKVQAKAVSPRILIVVGADEQNVPPTLPPNMTLAQTKKMLRDARMVHNGRDLAGRLAEAKGGPDYQVRFTAFEDEDHLTVVPATISRALAFALRR